MSYVSYGLQCWGRANNSKINETNRLINRAIRCIYFKNWKENIFKINLTKKMLNIEKMYYHNLRIFMNKFKRDILPDNLMPCFTDINKLHNHLTIFLATDYFLVFMISSHYPTLVENYGKNNLEI